MDTSHHQPLAECRRQRQPLTGHLWRQSWVHGPALTRKQLVCGQHHQRVCCVVQVLDSLRGRRRYLVVTRN